MATAMALTNEMLTIGNALNFKIIYIILKKTEDMSRIYYDSLSFPICTHDNNNR